MATDYTLNFDGAAVPNPGRGGAGGIVKCGSNHVVKVSVQLGDSCTSNMVEYCGLIQTLSALLSIENRPYDKTLTIRGDSKLVLGQMVGENQVRGTLIIYHAVAHGLASRFADVVYKYVPRNENRLADNLAKSGVEAMQAQDEYIVYRPNLRHLSTVYINGNRFNCTNDDCSVTSNKSCMVDARLLLSLPGYGAKTLERDIQPVHYSRCIGSNFSSNVLGAICMDISFSWGYNEGKVRKLKGLSVLVVDSLPVPFHIAARHPAFVKNCISEDDGINNFERSFKKENIPMEYRNHDYWKEESGNIIFIDERSFLS